MTLASGSVLSGTGAIQLEGSCRIALTGDVTVGIGLINLTGASAITGGFMLTVAPGSTLRFDHSSIIPGSVTVDGTLLIASSSVTLTVSGTLTLDASGTLDNAALGRIQVAVGRFINNGGTIIGNPPESFGGVALAPQILEIAAINPATGGLRLAQASPTPDQLRISWSGRSHCAFVIEASNDLAHWSEVPGTVLEVTSGLYEGRLTRASRTHQFFRIRMLPNAAP